MNSKIINGYTRVLGVDPGSRITGYAVLVGRGSDIRTIDYGAIRMNAKSPLPERLITFSDEFERLLNRHELTDMAIESVFTAKNVQSILKLGHIRGVAIMLAARCGLEISEYPPASIKQGIVGYGRATKEQVQYMVQKILRLSEPPKPTDVSDALAIAICHLNNIRLKKRIRSTS